VATKCKNCSHHTETAFCGHCGQSTQVTDIGWKSLWDDFRILLVPYDSSIAFTLRELFIRPGYFVKDFLSGKRMNRVQPMRLTLTLATVYIALVNFLKMDFIHSHPLVNWIFLHYGAIEVGLIPMMGLVAALVFFGFKLPLPVFFGLAGYMISQQLILKIVILLIAKTLGYHDEAFLFHLPSLISLFVNSWALWQFFDSKSRWWRSLHILLFQAVYAIAVIGLAYAFQWLVTG
jgi:hypothetical protein